MAGDVNVLVHRERVHATDNPITIRPSGLAGVTPKAVYAFCSDDFTTDESIGADAGFSEGFTDGTTTCSKGVFEEDAQATTQIRTWQSDGDLCQIINVAGTELLALDSPSLVSGGLNLTPSTRTNRPTVTYVFYYGADLQVASGKITGFDAGGGDAGGDTVAVTTGLSGSNLDNQLILFLTGQIGPTWTSASQSSSSTTSRAIGAAYRDGVAGAPDAQWATTYATRQGAGVGRCENTVRTDRVSCAIVSGSLNKTYSCADISDATFTVQAFGTAQNTPMAYLVLETDTKKTWCGVEDSSTTGTWTVTSPGWEPGFVQANFSQATALSAIKTGDLDVYGCAVATADDQSCQTSSNEDASADTVCKSLASPKFLDALEDDGTNGWEQAATGDFVFSATGWTVSNITVGTAGASARKFPCFAMEVAAGAGPETDAITEGATGTESFIGTATAFSLFTDAINAADVKSGVAAALAELLDGSLVDSIYGGAAAASAGIVDGVDATEGDVPTASATGVTVESAEADLLIDAIAQAAAAILGAAQAGEAWVESLSGLVGNIIEAAAADASFEPSAQASARIDALVNAGEAWVAQLVGVEVSEVSANTEASDAFFSAAQTIASIVQTASAGEIMIAMAQALARISEAANASDAFTALVAGLLGQFSDGVSVGAEILSRADMVASMFEDGAAGDAFTGETVAAPLGELLAAISADALFNATATVSAALSAGALAGAVFSALEPTEALGHLVVGAISIRATLMGIGALGPAIRGKPSVN